MINPHLNIAAALTNRSPQAPTTGGAMTIKGDEVYTRMGESLSPASKGWTIHSIEREARY